MLCPHCGSDTIDTGAVCSSCGQHLRDVLSRGAVVASRYEILSPLGRGGMGIVYKAHDRILDETVALKVLRSEMSADQDLARRFRSEIKLARRVRHRNVCGIHEYGEDGALHYIAMELVNGVDLKQILRGRGALPTEEAYDVALQVAQGLAAIHAEGVVHRDLKPANIMLDDKGVVRLMDFGIAKRWEDTGTSMATAAGLVVGTPEYMSPEQASGQRIDPRSDVYALGIVVFEIFTGQVPFLGNTPVATIFLQLREPPPLDGPEASRLPLPLVAVLAKALGKRPDDRFSTVEEMIQALAEARATPASATITMPRTREMSAPAAPPAAREPTPTPPAPRPSAERPPPPPRPQAPPPAPYPVAPPSSVRLWMLLLPVGAAAFVVVVLVLAFVYGRGLLVDLVDRQTPASEETPSASTPGPTPEVAELTPPSPAPFEAPRPPGTAAAGPARPSPTVVPTSLAPASPAPSRLATPPPTPRPTPPPRTPSPAPTAPPTPAATPTAAPTATPAPTPAPTLSATPVPSAGRGGLRAPRAEDRLAFVQQEMARGPAAAVPVLRRALKDTDWRVRGLAVSALGSFGAAAAAAVPELAESLQHDADWRVRVTAATALGEIGSSAAGAVPALVASLGDSDEGLRTESASALAKVGSPALPALGRTLRRETPAIHLAAQLALTRMGPPAVPTLIDALQDENPRTRRLAAEALGNMGPKAKDAVLVLRMATRDPDGAVRTQANQALKKVLGEK